MAESSASVAFACAWRRSRSAGVIDDSRSSYSWRPTEVAKRGLSLRRVAQARSKRAWRRATSAEAIAGIATRKRRRKNRRFIREKAYRARELLHVKRVRLENHALPHRRVGRPHRCELDLSRRPGDVVARRRLLSDAVPRLAAANVLDD